MTTTRRFPAIALLSMLAVGLLPGPAIGSNPTPEVSPTAARPTTPSDDPVTDASVADVPEAFCAAVATVPLRWTTDALVPMHIWVSAFADLPDTPGSAAAAVERILGFTRARLRWSLGGDDERPLWDDELDAAALALIDAAITSCPDLPLAIGPPGISNRPSGWDDLDEQELRTRCAAIAERVRQGIEEFETAIGRPPRHQAEMDLPSRAFVSSDWHGILIDERGEATVVPVPGGGCDLEPQALLAR